MGLLSIVGAAAGFMLGGPQGAAIGASIGGSIDSSNAAKSAANTQANAAVSAAQLQKQTADENLAFQKQMYNENVQRQEPWYNAGVSALDRIQAGLATGGEFSGKFTGQTLYDDPSYKWRVEQGQKALEQSAAARGIQFSGGTMAALEKYGQDMASQEYQNAYTRYYADQDRTLGRLGALASAGSTTAGGLTTLGSNYANNFANINQTSAANQSAYLTGAANASSAGSVASNNISNQMMDQVLKSDFFKNLSGPSSTANFIPAQTGQSNIYTPSQSVWE